jgi:SNF2 family DNA or RNA helicase
MAKKTFFMRGCAAIDKNKKTYEEKAQETKQHSARLAEMQKYVDMSEEKRSLLMDLVLNGRSSDSDESLLEKGVIIYIEFLDVIAQIAEDFEAEGIDVSVIQGSTKEKDRGSIAREFKENPNSKVVLISNAAGESLNLNGTNEIILYDMPKGSGKYNQILGRVARSFSRFENEGRSFYIHYVIVDDTLDVYKPILLSSKKQLEEDILHADTINLKGIGSFDNELLKKVRKDLLWKEKEKRKLDKSRVL